MNGPYACQVIAASLAQARAVQNKQQLLRSFIRQFKHPDVAQSLENHAALLRQTARADDAEGIEVRTKAIRTKSE
jgi:hypothetical protein